MGAVVAARVEGRDRGDAKVAVATATAGADEEFVFAVDKRARLEDLEGMAGDGRCDVASARLRLRVSIKIPSPPLSLPHLPRSLPISNILPGVPNSASFVR